MNLLLSTSHLTEKSPELIELVIHHFPSLIPPDVSVHVSLTTNSIFEFEPNDGLQEKFLVVLVSLCIIVSEGPNTRQETYRQGVGYIRGSEHTWSSLVRFPLYQGKDPRGSNYVSM